METEQERRLFEIVDGNVPKEIKAEAEIVERAARLGRFEDKR